MQLTGIILAGGKSSRMGTDKAMLEVEGKTLLRRAVEFCRLFCDEILISSNIPEHEVEGCTRIPDEIKDCGPMGGIYSCLKQSKNEWNFVLSVDAIFVKHEFINWLISQASDCEAVIPMHKKGKEPLIALYNCKALEAFKIQLELKEYKMHFILEKINTCFVDSNQWIIKNPKLFSNINSPEDLIFV